MKIRSLLAIVFLSAATSAFAGHCPQDMKQIDEALSKNPSLSADQLSKVKALRAEGEALHNAGKHGQSVDKLGEALKILGLRQ